MSRSGIHPGLAAALRGLAAKKEPPTEADIPPPSVLPGRAPAILPGQLALAIDEELDEELDAA